MMSEMFDGAVVMSASPGFGHADAVLALAGVLRAAAPPGLRVLSAPFPVRLGNRGVQVVDDRLHGLRGRGTRRLLLEPVPDRVARLELLGERLREVVEVDREDPHPRIERARPEAGGREPHE